MMCRVVVDKFLPLLKFAPMEPLSSSTEPSHNTQDIIPDVLPSPSLSTNRKDLLEIVRESKLKASLTAFFGLDTERSTEEYLSLQSQQVKRYTLKNPDQYFKKLMENELYARDVRELLETTFLSRGYFVVGFLTTVGAVWTQSRSKGHSEGATAKLPVTTITGIPMPQLDPSISHSHSTTFNQRHCMHVAQEEIFAVAYCVVKMSYSFDKNAASFTRKTPVVGPPKRARARHLALGHGSDEEVDDGSDEECKKCCDTVVLINDGASEDDKNRDAGFTMDN
jgi:hypothetical protein